MKIKKAHDWTSFCLKCKHNIELRVVLVILVLSIEFQACNGHASRFKWSYSLYILTYYTYVIYGFKIKFHIHIWYDKKFEKTFLFISDNVDAIPLNLFERNLISTIQKKELTTSSMPKIWPKMKKSLVHPTPPPFMF